MDVQTKVLIAGAGPAGLTLAIELARRNIPHRIVEAANCILDGSRGKGIQPRTLEVFEDLGVLEAILGSGGPYPPFRVHLGPLSFRVGAMSKEVPPSPSVPYPNLWMLPQCRAGYILLARLAQLGSKVEFGSSLIGFEQDDTGVTASVSRGPEIENVRADYLVACDGAHSFVRKSLSIPFEGKALQGPAVLVADVEIEGLDRSQWHAWPLAKGCILTLCPLPGTSQFQLAASLSKGVLPPNMDEDSVRDFIASRLGNYIQRVGRVSWLSLFRPQVRMVNSYRVRRILLAGDAAHVHPPSGGQGLNTGIQDAYNLGWKLANALRGAPETLLETYESERLPVAANVLGLSTKLMNKRSFKRGSETKQLALHYRESAISINDVGNAGRVRAGDRAPDAPCSDESGAPRRLFEIFRGPQFTLLVFGDSQNEVLARAKEKGNGLVNIVRVLSPNQRMSADALLDCAGYARQAYDVRNNSALVAVRPDGYIGYFGSPGSWPGLDRFLSSVLPGGKPESREHSARCL